MSPLMMQLAIFAGVALLILVISWAVGGGQDARIKKRIARVQRHKQIGTTRAGGEEEQQSLRRRTSDTSVPFMNAIVEKLPNLEQFRARLEKAGFSISAERYVLACAGATLFAAALIGLPTGKPALGLFAGIILGIGLPHLIVGMAASKRVKKFIGIFPDAIDLIVRGLRSGLPVTESIQMVAKEVPDPVGSVFANISESIRLGVPVEKALQDTAKKMGSTEFNFFVTSIVLQRETGGNLSEILNNLSEVLRKRFMMRMKIKALSSEAKASAIIVGALPFVVTLVLACIQPDYLRPLIDDVKGNIALLGAITSLGLGVGIMMKMSRFEI